MIEEFLAIFVKIIYRGFTNGSISTIINKIMVQADADNNMNAVNEINYNYARTNNKGIILLPESLRIDTTLKIQSLTIKLKNIDTNGNKKISFSR